MKLIYRIIFVALFLLILILKGMEVSIPPYYEVFTIILAVIVFIASLITLYKEDKENGGKKLKGKLIKLLFIVIVLIASYIVIYKII